MEQLSLSVHVMAAIVFVGGSAVATSLFPRYVPATTGIPPDVAMPAAPGPPPQAPGERTRVVAVALHRITGGYRAFGLIVPAAGIVLAYVQGRSGETLATVLTAAAGLLLAPQIHPRRRDALANPGNRNRLRPLHMLAGLYDLLWAVVLLMIVRPGSATGA
ncbi:hypothetical protein [Sphaerisporangium fuscum]|uniref:hypothetical protein n=1 Tax=Sphaerisporangium fuscum TaxID=2835868 RepID=UPI001BDD8FF4|nr:hypothetical protein [Sphaerisporangium fuscum]